MANIQYSRNEVVYFISPAVSNEALNTLFISAWVNHIPRDFAPILSHSLAYICAYRNNILVGFVNLAWDGGIHAFILDTTVHADYQRQGIGQNLVEQATTIATEQGIEWLHVDYEQNLDSFYKTCGFNPTFARLRNLKLTTKG